MSSGNCSTRARPPIRRTPTPGPRKSHGLGFRPLANVGKIPHAYIMLNLTLVLSILFALADSRGTSRPIAPGPGGGHIHIIVQDSSTHDQDDGPH